MTPFNIYLFGALNVAYLCRRWIKRDDPLMWFITAIAVIIWPVALGYMLWYWARSKLQ